MNACEQSKLIACPPAYPPPPACCMLLSLNLCRQVGILYCVEIVTLLRIRNNLRNGENQKAHHNLRPLSLTLWRCSFKISDHRPIHKTWNFLVWTGVSMILIASAQKMYNFTFIDA